MTQQPFESQKSHLHGIEIKGMSDEACQRAVNEATEVLSKRLPSYVQKLIFGTEITIANGLIESGGLTKAEEKKIILDATKNALSLQSAEDLLVSAGYLEPGDWTKALPFSKEQPWSCLTYQLVHEFGHLIDGLSSGEPYDRLGTQFSPTKYGETSPSESFAEAFAYWVFELDLEPDAQQDVSVFLAQNDAI
ncbi:MAG: hypothetical protein WCJ60_01970 [bacterium]